MRDIEAQLRDYWSELVADHPVPSASALMDPERAVDGESSSVRAGEPIRANGTTPVVEQDGEILVELDLRPETKEHTMSTKQWLLVGVAAALALIVGIVVINAQDDDLGQVDSVNSPDQPTNTTASPAPTTTVAERTIYPYEQTLLNAACVLEEIDRSPFLRWECDEAADLSFADLSGASLSGADLSGADLRGADLTSSTNLIGANLAGADLTGAQLFDVNLRGADLTGANLTGARLIGANLTIADLTGADLTGAEFTNADLSGADLTGTNLTDAYLANGDGSFPADLTDAILTDVVGYS